MIRRGLPALFVLVAALAPTASAQPIDPEAVRLYEEGQRYFRIAEYGQAIERLKAAYLKAPLPELLYDLGQAFRLKGDCAEALSFYRRFIAAAPSGPRLERAQARIAEMQQCVARDSTAPAPAPVLVPTATAPVMPPLTDAVSRPSLPTSPSPAEADRRVGRKRLGLAAGVTAAALAITSGTFAWRALDASDDLSDTYVPGSTWTAGASDTERRGILSDRIAIATGVGALVAAGVAAWLYWK